MYGHSRVKILDPVRSPIEKHLSARLVVGSVTTSEHRVLYISFFLFLLLFFYSCPQSLPKAFGDARKRSTERAHRRCVRQGVLCWSSVTASLDAIVTRPGICDFGVGVTPAWKSPCAVSHSLCGGA
ncbi:hypothetical protein IF1G_07148 [Cordyceps javanica]|uniref:Uncharacterized protein n=1 Tax=Cordyceps javanica TaxID=43265 RepID=A0A545UXT7_9HYPO|nr:hypothetical protein IF1G_07148 [Cordyceps javanica]